MCRTLAGLDLGAEVVGLPLEERPFEAFDSVSLSILAAGERRGWQVVSASCSESVSLSPTPSSCSDAIVAVVRADEIVPAEELFLRLSRREESESRHSRRRACIAVLAVAQRSNGGELDADAVCSAQRRLLACGASDVVAAFRQSEEQLELDIAMRLVKFSASSRPAACSCDSEVQPKSTSLLSLNFSEFSDAEDEMASSVDGLSPSSDVTTQASADECLPASSPRFVDTGVNTDVVMDAPMPEGDLRRTSSSKPPRPPGNVPGNVCSKPRKMTSPSSMPRSVSAEAVARSHVTEGALQGRWAAMSVLGAKGCKLAPAFSSILISGTSVTLSDGCMVQLEKPRGKILLLGGELRIEDGKLLRKGQSGAVIIFRREVCAKSDVATAGAIDTIRGGNRTASRSRRERVRSFFSRQLRST